MKKFGILFFLISLTVSYSALAQWPLGTRIIKSIYPDKDGDLMCWERSDPYVLLRKCNGSQSQLWIIRDGDVLKTAIHPYNETNLCVALQDWSATGSYLVIDKCDWSWGDYLWDFEETFPTVGRITSKSHDHVILQAVSNNEIIWYAPIALKRETRHWDQLWFVSAP